MLENVLTTVLELSLLIVLFLKDVQVSLRSTVLMDSIRQQFSVCTTNVRCLPFS